MKTISIIVALLLLACVVLAAPPGASIAPRYVPDTDTTVITGTVYLRELRLTNTSTSATVTCAVLDKQGTPLPLLASPDISPKQTILLASPSGQIMLGGVSWSCSAANTIVGSITYEK